MVAPVVDTACAELRLGHGVLREATERLRTCAATEGAENENAAVTAA